MHTLLATTGLTFFVLVIWLPIAILLHSLINSDSTPFKNVYKRLFYDLLALPYAWYTEVTVFIGWVLKKVTVLSKIATWFKS